MGDTLRLCEGPRAAVGSYVVKEDSIIGARPLQLY